MPAVPMNGQNETAEGAREPQAFSGNGHSALREANDQLAEANAKLKAVTEHVDELKEKLAKLTHDFEVANASKQEAMDAVDQGERKLNLAQRLATALSSENERWGENVQTLRRDAKLLTGDVLLASAFISYAGYVCSSNSL
mmetsp:Transcript_10475/g.21124  ORF Transcript_10475/g.21124 Transcript_10475/m.21124 type:complete len:141 (-) Transcript_10475:2698-3120(-)